MTVNEVLATIAKQTDNENVLTLVANLTVEYAKAELERDIEAARDHSAHRMQMAVLESQLATGKVGA